MSEPVDVSEIERRHGPHKVEDQFIPVFVMDAEDGPQQVRLIIERQTDAFIGVLLYA